MTGIPQRAWMVRAGNDNYLADQVEEAGAIAIGWVRVGDLSDLLTREDYKDQYRLAYPSHSPGRVSTNAGQLFNFAVNIAVDDYVLTYDKSTRELIIGVVKSAYFYQVDAFDGNYPNIRQVNWVRRVSRDWFSQSARNSMGSTLTVFRLNDHIQEIHTAAVGGQVEPDLVEEIETEPPFHEDVKSRADEFISDLISELDGYQFQDLAAAVLRAMGLYAVSMPEGRDRGIDIVASSDPLGLEEPRIKAQVKHRQSRVSGEEMRAFLTASRGYSGLFLSTGGFTSDAKYEAERADKPVSMMERDEFIKLLLEFYDELEPEFQALVPLIQIWVPVTE